MNTSRIVFAIVCFSCVSILSYAQAKGIVFRRMAANNFNTRNHYNSNGSSAGWSTTNGNRTNYHNSNGSSAGWSTTNGNRTYYYNSNGSSAGWSTTRFHTARCDLTHSGLMLFSRKSLQHRHLRLSLCPSLPVSRDCIFGRNSARNLFQSPKSL